MRFSLTPIKARKSDIEYPVGRPTTFSAKNVFFPSTGYQIQIEFFMRQIAAFLWIYDGCLEKDGTVPDAHRLHPFVFIGEFRQLWI